MGRGPNAGSAMMASSSSMLVRYRDMRSRSTVISCRMAAGQAGPVARDAAQRAQRREMRAPTPKLAALVSAKTHLHFHTQGCGCGLTEGDTPHAAHPCTCPPSQPGSPHLVQSGELVRGGHRRRTLAKLDALNVGLARGVHDAQVGQQLLRQRGGRRQLERLRASRRGGAVR